MPETTKAPTRRRPTQRHKGSPLNEQDWVQAALDILVSENVRGIKIDNHKTTLPASKGLSSSAAVCVLIARAFNLLFDLGLTARGEMEAAYAGEVLTPSKCGRMDQCVAFGHR